MTLILLSELVADVTITKVYPILKGKYSDKYFKIDLKYNELYKGTPIKQCMFMERFILIIRFMVLGQVEYGAKVGERLIILRVRTKKETMFYIIVIIKYTVIIKSLQKVNHF